MAHYPIARHLFNRKITLICIADIGFAVGDCLSYSDLITVFIHYKTVCNSLECVYSTLLGILVVESLIISELTISTILDILVVIGDNRIPVGGFVKHSIDSGLNKRHLVLCLLKSSLCEVHDTHSDITLVLLSQILMIAKS